MRSIKIVAMCVLAAVMAACSTVPVRSIWPLSRIDARTTDVPALRVAVQLPAMIRPREGGVMLEVILQTEGLPEQKRVLLLVEKRDEQERQALPAAAANSEVFAFGLAPQEILVLEKLRADSAEASKGKKSQLTLNVLPRHFCLTGAKPQHPVLATIYLKTSETRTYVALIQNVDFLADPHIAKEIAGLTACPG